MSTTPQSVNWITDRIALGDIRTGGNIGALKSAGIDVVVIALPALPLRKMDYVNAGISFLHIPSQDHPNENLGKYFDLVYEFISAFDDAGRKILVHCHAGISRSATLLTSYIMKKYNMNVHDAIAYIRKNRSIIHPNSGFVNQLAALERKMRSQ